MPASLKQEIDKLSAARREAEQRNPGCNAAGFGGVFKLIPQHSSSLDAAVLARDDVLVRRANVFD
jgi:hypothetical protein